MRVRVEDGGLVWTVQTPQARRIVAYLLKHEARLFGHDPHTGQCTFSWSPDQIRASLLDQSIPIERGRLAPGGG
jgi:hypothetical protein